MYLFKQIRLDIYCAISLKWEHSLVRSQMASTWFVNNTGDWVLLLFICPILSSELAQVTTIDSENINYSLSLVVYNNFTISFPHGFRFCLRWLKPDISYFLHIYDITTNHGQTSTDPYKAHNFCNCEQTEMSKIIEMWQSSTGRRVATARLQDISYT
jgi:hypothetical protein